MTGPLCNLAGGSCSPWVSFDDSLLRLLLREAFAASFHAFLRLWWGRRMMIVEAEVVDGDA